MADLVPRPMPDSGARDPLAIDGNWRRSVLPMPEPAHLAMTLGESLGHVAALSPDAPAVVSATEHVTFAGLLGLVGSMADAIRGAGAPDGPVALLLPAGAAYIAACFACAAAGRPLLMVEVSNPPARNAALIAAAGATLVLHDGDAAAVAAAGRCASLVIGALPAPVPGPLAGPPKQPPGGLDAEAPAFLFATSGSSGEPKLVVYAQATVQAKVQCSGAVFGVGPGDTVMIAGSHANFGVLHHALVFLFRGAAICLHDMREGGLSGMFDAIDRFGVNHLRFTPSLFRTIAAMPEAASALHRAACIRFAGEPLLRSDIELARAHVGPDCAVQNLYGSTESMIFFWCDGAERLPDGPVVPNGRIYPVAEYMLLDDDGRPVAGDGAGELVISSRRHALGDWIDGRVDPARFPPDPRGGGRRLYRTGDIARVLPDGTMIVLGRKDRLLKINGQRLSLLEIEATLRMMPGCREVSVQPWPQGDTTQLAAFLVADGAGALPVHPGAWLAERLPRFMVPARFTVVAELPLLPAGKVDGRALIGSLAAAPAAATAPADDATDLLRFLADAFARVLDIPAPDPDADFFDLGGDSLNLLELTLIVERRTGRPLSPSAFLGAPTIRGLARLIELQAETAVPALPPLAAPHGLRLDMRGRLDLRRIRHARGISRGQVLGMPGVLGHAAVANTIAANAMPDHEVWAFVADLGGGSLLDGEAWLACALEIAERLAATGWLRPQLLFGYSIGGYASWLVDRVLAAGGGWSPGRIIVTDAAPVHLEAPGTRARVEDLIAGAAARPAEMLLLHRRRPAPFSLAQDAADRWRAIGVPFRGIDFATLSHTDMNRKAVIRAMGPVMTRFAETGTIDAADEHSDIVFDTTGGRIHRLLTADEPPGFDELRGLIAPAGLPTNEGQYLLALLFMLIAVGDQPAALDFARRMLAEQRHHPRAVTYAAVGLLAVGGAHAEAAALAESWCDAHGNDASIRARAGRTAQPPTPWSGLAGLCIGTDTALDRVLDLMAARGGRAAG
ncbi:non-ribosomal peptide synthetase [Methylobrevis albus]|uniref:Non-ribosomal peptide synthetase n=1 Tax=Methylobrevis albus TaxID=2793297 RepID=A0A931I4D3_9HYPH|nr:non-ribosomal peptide synthetase [Methylobrevis albus]MBH0239000.1 non-ribosomal peptide synthetase [Methylobrevis albus]